MYDMALLNKKVNSRLVEEILLAAWSLNVGPRGFRHGL
jgi:hypothetical protein